jgi:UDP-N-acetylglucosamine transferase subunit ALG13
VILVTVGTERFPFERLLAAVDALAASGALGAEEVFVQHGASRPPRAARGEALLPFDDLLARMRAARVVLAHAGVGSVLLANRAGKVPLVMPRRARLGEHVDDHQVEFAERMARLGRAVVVEDADALAARLREPPPPLRASEGGRASFAAALERIALDLVRGRGRRG